MADVIVGVLAVAGSVFVLLAGVGVLRFPDLYARMHAGTKATTVGIALVGGAGVVAIDGGTAKIVLAVVVIFVTAPSAAHFVGRTAYRAEGVDLRLDGYDDLGDVLGDDAES